MPTFRARIFSRSFRGILATAGLAFALPAPLHAQDTHAYEPSLVRRLPPYCKHTMFFSERVPGGNDRAEIERWKVLMGPTFIHMHHYCYGLMATERAMLSSPTRADRMHNLGVSIVEFDYVIERAPPGFGLLPEILTRKGENLIQLDKAGEGVRELVRATQVKADYTPAYAAISDYYKETGDLAKAREWLDKGLSAAPKARALMRRVAQLDAQQGRRKSDRQPSAGR